MTNDWTARTILRDLGRELSRVWGRLALTDLVVRALSFVVLTPVAAFILRWFLQSGGSTGAVADQAILFFFLSPIGTLTLFGIGSITAAIYFAEIGALLVIAAGDARGARIWPRGALQFLAPNAYGLLVLALSALFRLVLIAAPFLAISSLVYALLLTQYDIYYYINVQPPEYWIALALIVSVLTVGGVLVVRRLLCWSFAIPILLFENATPHEALRASDERTRLRLPALAAWHVAWLTVGFVVSSLSAAAVGLIGRVLIRPDAGLAIVAAGTGVVASISLLVYLATLIVSIAAYVVLIRRLYWSCRPSDVPEQPLERLDALHDLRWNPLAERLGRTLAVGAAVGVIVLAGAVINRVRIDPLADVTAHRGAKYEAPENTIPAFERAIELGADWVELDVQLTADGQVIVVHDREMNRISDSNLRVEEATLAQLRALDVGAWFGPEFRGVAPPTLEEVLEICRGRVGVNIELKYFGPDRGLAERVIEVVEDLGMADEVLLMSFAHDRIAEAKELRPEWQMGLLLTVTLGDALRLDADFYAVPPSLATRGFIRAAHRLGRDVHVWTVDDPVRISAMMSRGADNLYTGSTSIVRRVLAERAALGPVERLLIDLAADLGVVRLPPEAPSTKEDA